MKQNDVDISAIVCFAYTVCSSFTTLVNFSESSGARVTGLGLCCSSGLSNVSVDLESYPQGYLPFQMQVSSISPP
jgi:hypothetical protein